MNPRKKLFGILTAAQGRLGRLHGYPPAMRLILIFDTLQLFLFGALFVLLSLPAILARTPQKDFLKAARVDDDGGFLDSYSSYRTYYSMTVLLFCISMAMIALVSIGALSIPTHAR